MSALKEDLVTVVTITIMCVVIRLVTCLVAVTKSRTSIHLRENDLFCFTV